MGRHAKNIANYDSIEILAKDISNLSYGSLRDLIGNLADELKKQADLDLTKGRKKLYREMTRAIENLYNARDNLDNVWAICEPYTEEV